MANVVGQNTSMTAEEEEALIQGIVNRMNYNHVYADLSNLDYSNDSDDSEDSEDDDDFPIGQGVNKTNANTTTSTGSLFWLFYLMYVLCCLLYCPFTLMLQIMLLFCMSFVWSHCGTLEHILRT